MLESSFTTEALDIHIGKYAQAEAEALGIQRGKYAQAEAMKVQSLAIAVTLQVFVKARNPTDNTPEV